MLVCMLFESSRFELREFYNMSIHTSSSSGIACAIAATRSAKSALQTVQTCETNAQGLPMCMLIPLGARRSGIATAPSRA